MHRDWSFYARSVAIERKGRAHARGTRRSASMYGESSAARGSADRASVRSFRFLRARGRVLVCVRIAAPGLADRLVAVPLLFRRAVRGSGYA